MIWQHNEWSLVQGRKLVKIYTVQLFPQPPMLVDIWKICYYYSIEVLVLIIPDICNFLNTGRSWRFQIYTVNSKEFSNPACVNKFPIVRYDIFCIYSVNLEISICLCVKEITNIRYDIVWYSSIFQVQLQYRGLWQQVFSVAWSAIYRVTFS